jgi:hypothetical protein
MVRLREVKEKNADEPDEVVDPPDCQYWLFPIRPAKAYKQIHIVQRQVWYVDKS